MEISYILKLDNGGRYEVRGAADLGIEVKDQCVVRKDFYQDFGVIVRKNAEFEDGTRSDLPSIIRKATVHDLSTADENLARAKSSMRTADRFITDLKLEMKTLNAHYSLDGKQLTIQFTADGRVDFRELVKELSRALNTRIELRQIGVRDETAIFGGISICGQELCCSRFLKEFSSINVKMAKDQDLSLTPSTISGICGRLKCCLKFEHEGYLELEKTMPRRGDYCECSEGRGRVCDRNLLTQSVSVQLESGNIVRCPAAETKPCGRCPSRAPEKTDRPDAASNSAKNGAPAPRRDRNNNDRNRKPADSANAPGGNRNINPNRTVPAPAPIPAAETTPPTPPQADVPATPPEAVPPADGEK